jgi:hypothetical protein
MVKLFYKPEKNDFDDDDIVENPEKTSEKII